MHDRIFFKPNKQLARVLADRKEQNSLVGMMIDEDGKIVKDLVGKLNIFASDNTNLYKYLDPSLEYIKEIFGYGKASLFIRRT